MSESSAGNSFVAVTPGGTVVMTTEAKTRQGAIDNLLREAAHMPYGTWENFEKRGYTIEEIHGE